MKKTIITICSLVVIVAASLVFFAVAPGKIKDRQLIKPTLSDKLPQGFDSAYVEKLSKMGMNTTKEAKLLIYTKERRKWKQEYGLNFMGDDEVKVFLAENSFILGEADKFLHMVPAHAGKGMIENFERVCKPGEKIYRYWIPLGGPTFFLKEEDLLVAPEEGDGFDYWNFRSPTEVIKVSSIKKYNLPISIHYHLRKEPPSENKIYIIGAAKDFNKEGMIIEDHILKAEPPKDPIAVLKVEHGYVELAHWE